MIIIIERQLQKFRVGPELLSITTHTASTVTRLKDSVPDAGRHFLFYTEFRPALGPTDPPSLYNGYQDLLPRT
jgi:hypothetical protein